MPVETVVFDEQMTRLLGALEAGRPKSLYADWLGECERLLRGMDGATNATLIRTVDICVKHLDRHPSPKDFAEIARLASSELALEAERARRKALPPPAAPATPVPPPSRPDRAFWDRNVAIGKARGRRKQAAADAYRKSHGLKASDPVPLDVIRAAGEPSPEEVAAVLAEMSRPQSEVLPDEPSEPDTSALVDPDAFLESISLKAGPRVPEWPGAAGTRGAD